MLHLCDRYPHSVPVKGGRINFNAKLMFITSNQPPNKWYPNITTLERRIDLVFNLNKDSNNYNGDKSYIASAHKYFAKEKNDNKRTG